MPLAVRIAESAVFAGVSPDAGRPLFVPAGIAVVRTGPTTQEELDRLLGDPDSEVERSGVRLSAGAVGTASGSSGLLHVLAVAVGLAPSKRRPR